MDIVKFLYTEFSCFIKACSDIFLQKLEQVFRRNKVSR